MKKTTKRTTRKGSKGDHSIAAIFVGALLLSPLQLLLELAKKYK